MKWYKSRTMYLSGLMGMIGGIVFLVAGLWLVLTRQHLAFSPWAFIYIHRIQPMIIMLDLAPVLFGIMAGLAGFQYHLTAVISRGKREWETTFAVLSDLIFITDVNGKIVRCNHAVLDRINLAYRMVLGRQFTDVLDEGRHKEFGEVNYHGSEFLWYGRIYSLAIYPIKIGEVTGKTVCVMHDITERKTAENNLFVDRNLLRTLIDNLPDRIYVKDSQGRKTLSNNADMLASGAKTMQEIIGKTAFERHFPAL